MFQTVIAPFPLELMLISSKQNQKFVRMFQSCSETWKKGLFGFGWIKIRDHHSTVPAAFQFSQPLWGGFLVGLKPWLVPPCRISPCIPILWGIGPPMCLCAADAQAKQEETGDSHWRFRMQNSTSVLSLWRAGLSDYFKNQCRPSPWKWPHRPGQCGWQSYLPLWCRLHTSSCVCIMRVFESAVWQLVFCSTKLDNPCRLQTLQCSCRGAQTEK